jgi:hypothetical protein
VSTGELASPKTCPDRRRFAFADGLKPRGRAKGRFRVCMFVRGRSRSVVLARRETAMLMSEQTSMMSEPGALLVALERLRGINHK